MVQPSERVADTPRVSPVAIPNLLTYARIVAVPAVVASFYIPGAAGRFTALGIFILAAITDFFDGYLARAWGQQSALGRMLDPIADKLLVAAALLILVAEGTIRDWSIWAALVILSREILVSGLRESLAEVRVSVPVTRLAKWKTTVQMVAIAFLLVSPAEEAIVPYTAEIGLTLLWIAAIVTLYTGYDYFRAGFRHLLGQDFVKLLYFAGVRERIGVAEEEVALPAELRSAADLVRWLRSRGPDYDAALTDPAIRVALDREHAQPDAPLAGVREAALFPPMTGG